MFVYMRVCFLSLFVHVQGERGEPGFMIAADGSMTSGLVGPIGPKGDKVILVVTVFLLSVVCCMFACSSGFVCQYEQLFVKCECVNQCESVVAAG